MTPKNGKLADELLKKIKANQPEVLTDDTDFLGTIPKGDMIKGFLESLLDRTENDIQMIALYGEWGSGKTSLMNYVKSELNKNKFKTIFFPSWKMEKDNDLALSLLESIIESEDGIDKTDVKNAFLAIGKGIGKGLSAKLGPLNINFKEVIESLEEYNKSITDDSALKRIKEFETKYSELEKEVLEKAQCEKLIVFIDDLDRCEPENVLNLLSAIKLFFTYGKRTIFICGLDEKAVDQAVKVKYDDVVKSGEYMEKIFDISFDMPKPNIHKLIEFYFDDIPDIVNGVHDFFEEMHFTNPRHLKKVLNKYLLIRYYQASGLDKDGLIPDQNIKFLRHLTLFIIMVYKFEPDNFEVIKDYDNKISYYFANRVDKNKNDGLDIINRMLIPFELREKDINSMHKAKVFYQNYGIESSVEVEKETLQNNRFFAALITIFAPKVDNYIALNASNHNTYVKQFEKYNNLLSRFCSYSYKHAKLINDSSYRLLNIFDMAELYL